MKDIVRTDDSRLLRESNLTTRHKRRVPHHIIHLRDCFRRRRYSQLKRCTTWWALCKLV